MSSARTVIRAAALAAFVLSSSSCSSLRCAVLPPYGDPLIEVAYISEGDGPTMTLLSVYSHGLLELEPVGLRRRCAWSRQTDFAMLKREVSSTIVIETLRSPSSPLQSIHAEMVSIRLDGPRVTVETSQIPSELGSLLGIVDKLFFDAFGGSYTRFARLPSPEREHTRR